MSDIEKVPNDDLFINQLSEMYSKSKRDDEFQDGSLEGL